MNVNKKKMTLVQKIFYIFSFIFLIGVFIYLGTKDYTPKKTETDAQIFTKEYGITEDNVFTERDSKTILELLNSGSGIIFIGFPENIWSASIADILNESAKKMNIDTIYYYNLEQDRKEHNYYYEHMIEILMPYLKVLDNEDVDIYAPTVLIVKNGEVIYFDDETSIVMGDMTVANYWTETKTYQKGLEYMQAMNEFLGGSS